MAKMPIDCRMLESVFFYFDVLWVAVSCVDGIVFYFHSLYQLHHPGWFNLIYLLIWKEADGVADILHRLKLAIKDEDFTVAVELLSELPLLKKQYHAQLNYIFLVSMIKCPAICVILMESQSFPPNFHAPMVMSRPNKKRQTVFGRSQRVLFDQLIYPSYFICAVAYRHQDIVSFMLKVKLSLKFSFYSQSSLWSFLSIRKALAKTFRFIH